MKTRDRNGFSTQRDQEGVRRDRTRRFDAINSWAKRLAYCTIGILRHFLSLNTRQSGWKFSSNKSARTDSDLQLAPLWTAQDLQTAAKGEWISSPDPHWYATGITYWHRQIRRGDIALARDSKKWGRRQRQTDSLDYFFKRGAAAVIVSHRSASSVSNKPVLLVDDTRSAIDDIARAARARLKDTRVVAITGSAGKTTTKDFVRHLLSLQAQTFGSSGNHNAGSQVSLMLAETPPDSRYGVYEFAVDHPNVTLRKAKILRPHVTVITGIHPDHLFRYSTLEALTDQKCLLFDALEPGGIAVLNRDDALFRRQLNNARKREIDKVLTFGKAPGSHFRLLESHLTSERSQALACIMGDLVTFDVRYPGEYMLMNCLAALATVHAVGGSWRKALAEIPTLPQLRRRNERHLLQLEGGTIELINDTFSSNPASVAAGLSVLKLMNPPIGGRRIAIMGEIKDLGSQSARVHADMAPAVREAKIDLLFTLGAKLKPMRKALGNVPGLHCEDPNLMAETVVRTLRPGDIVWVKGSCYSHAMRKHLIPAIMGIAERKTPRRAA